MRISVVDKNSDLTSEPLRFLPEPSLLIHEKRKAIETQALLSQIREGNQELRCHCTEPAARMFVRYAHETYTIVNHAEQGAHHPDCPLVTEIHGYGERATPTIGAEKDQSDLSNFYLHREIKDAEGTHSPKHTRQAPSLKKEHKLDKLFRFMCSKTLSNWHYANKQKQQTQMRVLASFKAVCSEVPFGDTVLSNWVFYGNKGFEFASQSLIKSVKRRNWDGRGRPHAFWMTISDNVQIAKGHVLVDGVAYPYKRIIRPYAPASSPYFVSMSVCIDEGHVCSHTIYLRPIVARTIPMPVDSKFERKVALQYINWIDENSTRDQRWSLNKPIYSRTVEEGSPSVLPDFILQQKDANGRLGYKVVLEVMGGRGDDYYERKNRLMPIMVEAWNADRLYQIHDLNCLPIIQNQ